MKKLFSFVMAMVFASVISCNNCNKSDVLVSTDSVSVDSVDTVCVDSVDSVSVVVDSVA